jgi:hypothetical protein
VAGATDVDAQEHAVGPQRVRDRLEDDVGLGLVVHRVEHGDEVVLRRAVEGRRVLHLERDVRQPHLGGLGLPGRDPLLGEVEPGEAAVRELLGHQVDGVALAAADVAHVDAGPKPIDEPVDQRELALDEGSVVHLRAHLAHELLELGEPRVGHPTPDPEALHDLVLDPAHERGELGHVGQVPRAGRPREARRVLRRQHVGVVGRVVVDEAPHGHGVQPLPDVALVEAGGLGHLLAGRRLQLRQRVEQARPMPHAHHQREQRRVQQPHHLAGKGLDLPRIQLGRRHVHPPASDSTGSVPSRPDALHPDDPAG